MGIGTNSVSGHAGPPHQHTIMEVQLIKEEKNHAFFVVLIFRGVEGRK
jgi:hypothetical protein